MSQGHFCTNHTDEINELESFINLPKVPQNQNLNSGWPGSTVTSLKLPSDFGIMQILLPGDTKTLENSENIDCHM